MNEGSNLSMYQLISVQSPLLSKPDMPCEHMYMSQEEYYLLPTEMYAEGNTNVENVYNDFKECVHVFI